MKKVSRKIVDRALLYIRTLESLIKEKRAFISSKELGCITGITDVQIRKDISNFGRVGTPRVGYQTTELKNRLENFVLQDNVVRIVLFGAGNLGSAILKYPGFHRDKIKLVAAFDNQSNKVGQKVNGVTIYPAARAPQMIKRTQANIGIIAVPGNHCQEVADLMVFAGLRAIINFAPVSINVPPGVEVKDIDLAIEFLSSFVVSSFGSKKAVSSN